jgi:hypothetical protein
MALATKEQQPREVQMARTLVDIANDLGEAVAELAELIEARFGDAPKEES